MFLRPVLAVMFLFLSLSSAHAGFDEGKKAYDEKNFAAAIFNLRPLAESGDDRAMIILGNMYTEGLGVAQNFAEGYKLYLRAAYLNNKDATVAVAAMQQQGLGVERNARLATEWYLRAARMGHMVGALYYALHIYQGNKGKTPETEVTPNHKEAYKWTSIVALHAKDEDTRAAAKDLAKRIALKISPEDIADAQKQAEAWKVETPDRLGPFPAALDVKPQAAPQGSGQTEKLPQP